MNAELPGIHLAQRMAHGAGRDVVTRLASQIVEHVRPDELDVSMFVVNALIDRVASGDPATAGDDREWGLGGGELLAMALVPALMELLGKLLEDPGTAGTRPGRIPQSVVRETLSAWASRTGISLRGRELGRLTSGVEQSLDRAAAVVSARAPGASSSEILDALFRALG